MKFIDKNKIETFFIFFLIVLLVLSIFQLAFVSTVKANSTIIFSDGFESDIFIPPWTSTFNDSKNVLSISNDLAHHGVHSAKVVISGTTGDADVEKVISPQTTIFIRFYVRLTAFPAEVLNDYINLFVLFGGGLHIFQLSLIRREANSLKFRVYEYYPAEAYKYSSALDIAVDIWYCVEVKFVKHASAGEYRVWLNGTEVITDTGLDTSASSDVDTIYCPSNRQRGTLTNPTVYTDCVVVADAYIGVEEVKSWNNAELWLLNLHNYSWFNVENWLVQLHNFGWFNVETWLFNIHNFAWFTSEIWKISLGNVYWWFAELWSINLVISVITINVALLYSILAIMISLVAVVFALSKREEK